MSFNTETIVQEIRREFESMLVYVQESDDRTADQVERNIFKQLLTLGGRLMLLFFCLRAAGYPRTETATKDGITLPYFSEKKRSYYSIFGKLPYIRPYFYARGQGGRLPLDEELSLGDDCYSDLVRETAEYLGVAVPYQKVADFFDHLLGRGLSTQAIAQMIENDATDVNDYYAQKPAPEASDEASVLVIQADGKGVPMVYEPPAAAKRRLGKGEKRTKKKEAIVTTLYTLEPHPRTAETVVASFFKQEAETQNSTSGRNVLHNKHLWATLDGKDDALRRLAQQTSMRDGSHIEHRVALTDGCQALQLRVEQYFPTFTLVLDFVHVSEYFWKAANTIYGEQSPKRDTWVEAQALALLSGQTDQVIDGLEKQANRPKLSQARSKVLNAVANYFRRNLPYMHYDHYLDQGWPIASGVIEGACRHLVKDRCELSGARWTQKGAENLLSLRAVAENGDWDDYHRFRRKQRHLRLYGSSFPECLEPELQAIAPSDADNVIPFDRLTTRHLEHRQPALHSQAA